MGSEAVIQDDHMAGMKGATATIAGAYDTTAYVIIYTPTTGGAELFVWIIAGIGLVGVVCWALSRFVTRDSLHDDEEFTWLRDLNEHL